MHTDTAPSHSSCTPCLVAFTLSGALPWGHQPDGTQEPIPGTPRMFEARTEYLNPTQCPGTTGKWGLGGGEEASDIPQPGLRWGWRCRWPCCGRGIHPRIGPRCRHLVDRPWDVAGAGTQWDCTRTGWMSEERPGKGGGALCSLRWLPGQCPPLTHLTSTALTAEPGQASLPAAPVSGEAGGLPGDMPTHGSPAAARQATARVRPRAAVLGPAYRPLLAQPSAPALARDSALDSLARPRLLST